MNESRESKNAEQLEELLLLTEEIQEELEQKDQLIVELKTQLNESLTLNEKLNKENRAGNIQALKNDLKLFYFCDPDGHGPYVQCRDAMPVDEYTPKLGSLTMENIVATDAQFAGCYFDGLPEQPIERVTMRDVSITFDPNAEAGQAAMADNRPNVKKLAIYAENVKEIDLHNVKIEGYEGERLHFANVGHFEED